MSALKKNIDISNDIKSVTKISAQARIEYILRFSKQAILVIDESIEQNASIANQFLASLPEQHNVAYVALSSQFNNIQIRCRIIEQLYTGELFDPEISLAVSVINLAKKSKQSISIVLDSAQHLSLQIAHELTQLASIAKKANLVVNVVMFGSLQAGRNVALNKSLFDNKLSLLSSQSGQLLSTTSPIFKKLRTGLQLTKQLKWLLVALVIVFALATIVINLVQLNSFNFTKPLTAISSEKISLSDTLSKPQTMVLSSADRSKVDATAADIKQIKAHQVAAANDIYSLLVNPIPVTIEKAEVLPATPLDIISAITFDTKGKSDIADTVKTQHVTIESIGDENQLSPANKLQVNNDFFSNKTGYVIQLAAFSDLTLPEPYLNALSAIEYHIYNRILNDKMLMVITSKVYENKSAAQAAVSKLPAAIRAKQPWVKPIGVVNNEINAFQLSQ